MSKVAPRRLAPSVRRATSCCLRSWPRFATAGSASRLCSPACELTAAASNHAATVAEASTAPSGRLRPTAVAGRTTATATGPDARSRSTVAVIPASVAGSSSGGPITALADCPAASAGSSSWASKSVRTFGFAAAGGTAATG